MFAFCIYLNSSGLSYMHGDDDEMLIALSSHVTTCSSAKVRNRHFNVSAIQKLFLFISFSSVFLHYISNRATTELHSCSP